MSLLHHIVITLSTHITPILKFHHWLKINERIEYKLVSLTYKVLTTAQHSYLHNLISLQPPRSTRSSSVVTLSRSPTISSLKITDRSFRYASLRLWNQLSNSPVLSRFIISATYQPITLIIPALIIHHFFTPGSKSTFSTNPSDRRFLLPTGLLHDNGTGPDLSRSSFYFQFHILIFVYSVW